MSWKIETRFEMLHQAAEYETLYHITDKPNFFLDPDFEPEDNTLALQDRSGRKGIYLTDSPDKWRAHGYFRPYIVELRIPQGLAQPERWNGELFLPAEYFDQVIVNRVIPFDTHQQEQWGGQGTIEEYSGPASTPADKDVRDYTAEEHREHLQRLRDYLHDVQGYGWNEFDESGNLIGTDEYDEEGMPIRRNRQGEVMTRGRYV